MGRILWVLPLCLILQDQRILPKSPSERLTDSLVPIANSSNATVEERDRLRNELLASLNVMPSAGFPGGLSWGALRQLGITLEERDLTRHELVSALGMFPAAGFPAGLPWHALYQIGNKDLFPLENILVYQPTLFFQMCLDKHDRTIQSYTCMFCKQERVKGRKQNAEKIEVKFREQPYSVHFNWVEGAGLAKKVLYVEGENKGFMRVRPIFGWIMSKDAVEGLKTSRFTIKQYGMKLALTRTLESMLKAQAAGTLDLCYHGAVTNAKLGGRVCYKFVRKPYTPTEEDGLNELVIYIDRETWLQIGSELFDANGEMIAEYFFRDIIINPTYGKDHFTDKGL